MKAGRAVDSAASRPKVVDWRKILGFPPESRPSPKAVSQAVLNAVIETRTPLAMILAARNQAWKECGPAEERMEA